MIATFSACKPNHIYLSSGPRHYLIFTFHVAFSFYCSYFIDNSRPCDHISHRDLPLLPNSSLSFNYKRDLAAGSDLEFLTILTSTHCSCIILTSTHCSCTTRQPDMPFTFFSPKTLAGPGYILLNMVRVMNIVSLLAVITSSIVMVVKTVMISQLYFFDGLSHMVTAFICSTSRVLVFIPHPC